MSTTDPRRLAQAEAYVRTAFYPPLPIEYGALAVQAVDACNAGEPDTPINVAGLSLQPREADDDGNVRAATMVDVLRLWHLVGTETCGVCGQPDNCGDCTHEPV